MRVELWLRFVAGAARPKLRFVRYGRFSDIGFTGPRVRSWLQAVGQRIVN